MLHPVLIKKFTSQFVRDVYLSQKYPDHEYIRDIVNGAARNIRLRHQSTGTDPLKAKNIKYGNNGGWARNKSEELKKRRLEQISENKKPTDNDEWRSIEFEMMFKDSFALSNFIEWVCSDKRYSTAICVKTDGSLVRCHSSDLAREVVVTYKKGNEALVEDICYKLNEYGHVNNSCGTHVHFDMRHFPSWTVDGIARYIGMAVPALRTLMPYDRRQGEYCREDWTRTESSSRYAFVNGTAYKRHKTLEIRGHSATISAKKILNWIEICETIINKYHEEEKDCEPLWSLDLLFSHFQFRPEIKSYMEERYRKFNVERHDEEIQEAA